MMEETSALRFPKNERNQPLGSQDPVIPKKKTHLPMVFKIGKTSLAQEMRQKRDISERRRVEGAKQPSTLTLFAIRSTVLLCDLSGVILHQNEYSLFYQKFDAEYFFIQHFFRKKLYFQRKP